MWYEAPTGSSFDATTMTTGNVYPQLTLQIPACQIRYPIHAVVGYRYANLVTETHHHAVVDMAGCVYHAVPSSEHRTDICGVVQDHRRT